MHNKQLLILLLKVVNFLTICHTFSLYNIILGLTPIILKPNDPMTRDFRMDRVRIIVDPTRAVVIQIPVVG
jgi:hypothetical protein